VLLWGNIPSPKLTEKVLLRRKIFYYVSNDETNPDPEKV